MLNFIVEKSLDGVVATGSTNGKVVSVEGRKRIGIQLQCADHTSGNGVFTIEGTIDGTNWVALNMIIDNLTNTNAQGPVRIGSKMLNTNSTILLWLDEFLALKAIRVVVAVTTDGTYTATVLASE